MVRIFNIYMPENFCLINMSKMLNFVIRTYILLLRNDQNHAADVYYYCYYFELFLRIYYSIAIRF